MVTVKSVMQLLHFLACMTMLNPVWIMEYVPFVHVSTELIENEPVSDRAMLYEFLHVSDPCFRSEVLANSVNSLESIHNFIRLKRALPHVKHVKSKCRPHHLN